MKNTVSTLVLVLIAVSGAFSAVIKGKVASKPAVRANNVQLALTGRVTGTLNLPFQMDDRLIIELRDASLMDVASKLVARTQTKLFRFPATFTIKYPTKDLLEVGRYRLYATIENKKKEKLYTSGFGVAINPIGPQRTKTIDIPVTRVESLPKLPQIPKRNTWPELVGKKGEDVVKIIKQETKFTDVRVVKPTDAVLNDKKYDRVFVYVNGKGIVTSAPTIG